MTKKPKTKTQAERDRERIRENLRNLVTRPLGAKPRWRIK